jgi:hypothetical protein
MENRHKAKTKTVDAKPVRIATQIYKIKFMDVQKDLQQDKFGTVRGRMKGGKIRMLRTETQMSTLSRAGEKHLEPTQTSLRKNTTRVTGTCSMTSQVLNVLMTYHKV